MTGGRATRAVTTRLAVLVAAALVGLTSLAPAAGAIAAPETTGPTASPTPTAPATDALPVAVAVTDIAPQVLVPGEPLVVTATVRNDGSTTIEDPRATVRIYRYRLSSREQLDTWASAPASGYPAGTAAATVALGVPLAPGASTQVAVTVPPESIGLLRTPDAWGPRGITLDLTDGTERVGLERTFLLWASDDDVPHAQVSVVVPVVGPAELPATSTDGTSTTPSDLDSSTDDGRLRRLLDATGDADAVTWAVDPSLVEAASASTGAARTWLTELTDSATGREVLALPWADPDLAAIAHAGRAELLDAALAAGDVAEHGLLGQSSPARLLWTADDEPDVPTAELAAAHGAGAALVVGPGALGAGDASDGGSPAVPLETDQGSVTALVPDATLSSLLADPASVQPAMTPATAAQRLLAETAVLARESGSDGARTLVAVPRDWDPDVENARAQLAALSAAPWVDLTDVDDQLADARSATDDSTRKSATLPRSSRAGSELTPVWVHALADARAAADAFAAIVPDPTALVAGLDEQLLTPLSVSWRSDPDDRKVAVDAALAAAEARRSGLSVLLNEQFTVISSSTQIRLAVRNDLDQDAAVRVEMRPNKACVAADRSDLVTALAGHETPVTLQVEASANCDVKIDVELVSADGRVVATPVQISVRVAPTIESVGTIVVGALLAVALAFGLWRTIRRGQTARRGARVLKGEDDDGDPDGRDGHGSGHDGPGGDGPRGDGPGGPVPGGTAPDAAVPDAAAAPAAPVARPDDERAGVRHWTSVTAHLPERTHDGAPTDIALADPPLDDLAESTSGLVAPPLTTGQIPVTEAGAEDLPTAGRTGTAAPGSAASGLGRSSLIMAAGTAVSRVLGVVNIAMLAWAIGAEADGNAFSVANKLPNTLYLLIAGGLLNAVLVPQVVRAYQRADGQEYVDRLLTVGMVLLGGLTLVLTAAAPLFVLLYSDFPNKDLTSLAVAIAFWSVPQVFFYGVYSLLGQVLNARGSFGPYMWAPVVNNIVFIGGMAVFVAVYGPFTEDSAPWSGTKVALLAGSATLGIVAQALILLVPLYRSGFRYHPRWGLRGSGLGSAGRVASWTFAGLLVGQLGVLAVSRVASAVSENSGFAGNAVYDRAFLIFMLPHSLVTVSLATALFTRLSAKAARGDTAAVRDDLSLGLRTVGLFTILATVGITVLAYPLSRLLLSSQKVATVHSLADVVVPMVAGLVAFGAWSLCQRIYYAYEDARSMFPIQVLMAAVVVAGTLVGRYAFGEQHWVAVACGSMSVSYGLGAVLALVAIRRRLGGLDGRRVGLLHLKAVLAGIAAAAAGLVVLRLLGPVEGVADAAVACVAGGVAMSLVYVGVLWALRVRELRAFVAPVVRRLPGRH